MSTQLFPSIAMEIVTDPADIAEARERSLRFERNLNWFQLHAVEIGNQHRGKCICIAGEELFAADKPEEALAMARAAHPEDDGFFLHYIRREKRVRVYAS